MQCHVQRQQMNFQKRRLLISSLKAKDILLSTALLQWYISHGLIVNRIHHIIEFVPRKPFKKFVDEITRERKEGSRNPNKAVLAQTFKLIGNSSYGSMLIDKMKYAKTSLIHGDSKAKRAVNSLYFKELSMLGGELYELEEAYRSLKMTVPIYLGFQVLQLAKLRMLEFAYDFMAKYIERPLYQYLYCDTDSLYVSLARESLDKCVKPQYLSEFTSLHENYCRDSRAENAFLSRTCCPLHTFEDDKEPGLLKIEFHKGDIFIGLSSKTYVCRSSDKQLKLSCKGVNKSSVLARGGIISTFKTILSDGKSREASNSGIRMHGGVLKSYKQRKDAFAYFYVKREVGTEGIYTKPLNLTLLPFPQDGVPLQYYPELCMDYKWSFVYFDMQFVSIRQALVYYKVVDAPYNIERKGVLLSQIMTAGDADLQKIYADCLSYQAWESVKFYRVKDIVRVRLFQLSGIREMLLSTFPYIIYHAERADNEWGVGEVWDVVRWLKPSEIRGRNYLGLVYKEIRDECQ